MSEIKVKALVSCSPNLTFRFNIFQLCTAFPSEITSFTLHTGKAKNFSADLEKKAEGNSINKAINSFVTSLILSGCQRNACSLENSGGLDLMTFRTNRREEYLGENGGRKNSVQIVFEVVWWWGCSSVRSVFFKKKCSFH